MSSSSSSFPPLFDPFLFFHNFRHPPAPRPLTLAVYRASSGWAVVCAAMPANSNGIHIDTAGTKCTFTAMSNWIPEEAERGEYVL